MLESDSVVLDNLRIVDRAFEAFNKHSVDDFMDFYADSAVYNSLSRGEPLEGREVIREEFARVMFTSFPDIKIEKINAFGQDDWLCTEVILKGTHTGPMPGPTGEAIPATNKSIRVPMCLVFKIKDGKFIEIREYMDQLGLISQLGLQ
ncbi:MAG: ester cyclase [Promethearchaeota archaeon]|jgi:steroid delta-isomerase-like uncharacterized protein